MGKYNQLDMCKYTNRHAIMYVYNCICTYIKIVQNPKTNKIDLPMDITLSEIDASS